eukprot:765615-Hanusia_phi.AAC.1
MTEPTLQPVTTAHARQRHAETCEASGAREASMRETEREARRAVKVKAPSEVTSAPCASSVGQLAVRLVASRAHTASPW